MNPVFVRAFDSILRRLGKDAVLRGEVADPVRRVVLQHDTELTGEQGEIVGRRVTAAMWRDYAPMRGNTLAIGADNYIVDSPPILDDGISVTVVLRKV